MTSRAGARPPSPERGAGRPRAASIAPPIPAPEILENPILSAIRNNRLLDLIRHSDSARQIRRTARLVGDLAAITSTLAMAFADLLFCTMSGDSTERLQQRFIIPLQAVDILNTLCAQPLVLRDWFFSEEHCYLTARLLGAFTGFAGVQLCPADTANFFSVVSVPALLDEAPFLNAILFLMLNRSLPPLALAQCLSRARFGYWSDDRRTFFPERADRGQGLPIGWGMKLRRLMI